MMRLYNLIRGQVEEEEESCELGKLWTGARVMGSMVKVPFFCEGVDIVLDNLYDREGNPLGYDVNLEMDSSGHRVGGSYMWPLRLIQHINSYYCQDAMKFTLENTVITLKPLSLMKLFKYGNVQELCVDKWLWPDIFMTQASDGTCYAHASCPGTQILLEAREDDRIARHADVGRLDIRIIDNNRFYLFPIRHIFALSKLLRKTSPVNNNNCCCCGSLETTVVAARCAVCLQNPVAIANLPCGHIAMCLVCAAPLRNKACCICRAQVTSTVRLYFS